MNALRTLAPSSIFLRTTGTLLIAFLAFAILILVSVAHFTIIPLAEARATISPR